MLDVRQSRETSNYRRDVTAPMCRRHGIAIRTHLVLLLCCVFASYGGFVRGLYAEAATGQQAMVATVHPLATDAGIDALKAGGNAVDAAIAAALTLGVVDQHNSGLGGGCFILLRKADGTKVAIDGREMAPGAATRDMYVRDGKGETEQSQTGPLAVGVPGALAAYELALRDHGRLDLQRLILPAADLADRGFPIDRVFARNLRQTADILRRYTGSRTALLKPDGSVYRSGETLRQEDLARTYRAIARGGSEWFYQGGLAQAIGLWMRENNGIVTAADFANYRVIQREPIETTYREHTVLGFPPPSSGGVHVAQILNVLEHFDLRRIHEKDAAEFAHVVVEAMKLAFADRAYWLGDADYASVPRGLIQKEYAARLATHIDLRKTTRVAGQGDPPRAALDVFGKHTTHIAAADEEGNWVAITATVNTSFGSKVIVPGTGIALNNQMDDFSIQPGVPNAFGLVGGENNAIAPGKRPLSSMSPTIVLKGDRPFLTLGAAGGPRIISQVVLAIVRYVDLGQDIDAAIRAPRFHHQWIPDRIYLEESAPEGLAQKLRNLGHKVELSSSGGVTQAICVGADGRVFLGVHDPRVPGRARGR